MKCLLQELDLLNQAIYERKPLPSTQTTSKAVIDQLGKRNTQIIEVFQAAPLTLLALAGQQAIQRRIFQNAYTDERWLTIASFETILPEIVDLIRLFSFTLESETVALQRQRELEVIAEKFPAFDLKNPIKAYASSLDYLFRALANAVAGARLKFSEFAWLALRGENCGFSDGFVWFLEQVFNNVANSYLQAGKMFEIVLAALPRLEIKHSPLLAAILSSRTVTFLNARAGEVLLLCYNLLRNERIIACVSILSAFLVDLIDEKRLQREHAPSVRQLQAMLAKVLFDAVRHGIFLTAQAALQTQLQILPLSDRKWKARTEDIAAILDYFATLSRQTDFCMRNQPLYLVILHILWMVRSNGLLSVVFATQIALFDDAAVWSVNFEHVPLEQQLEFGLRDLEAFNLIKSYEASSIVEPAVKPAFSQVPSAFPARETSNKDSLLVQAAKHAVQVQDKALPSLEQRLVAFETDADMFGEDTKCDLDLKFV